MNETLLDLATERLSDAEANYETLRATAPDLRAAQTAMDIFRAEHADIKRQRESELKNFLAEHAKEKRQREFEFTALQIAAKAFADAKAEVIRAKRALAREEVTQAAKARREAKAQAKADEEAQQECDAAAYEAVYQKALREQPNALQERADREAAL